MALGDLAAHLATAGAELTVAAARLPGHDPGAGAFGAAASGRLGALGRELHRAYLVALDARAHEAGAHGARLSTTADALARAAIGYAASDGAAEAAIGYAAPADVGRSRHRETP
jgi:hypothetical protein